MPIKNKIIEQAYRDDRISRQFAEEIDGMLTFRDDLIDLYSELVNRFEIDDYMGVAAIQHKIYLHKTPK